jgi:hypothetical protein
MPRVPGQQRRRHGAVDEHKQSGKAKIVGVHASEIRAQIHPGV